MEEKKNSDTKKQENLTNNQQATLQQSEENKEQSTKSKKRLIPHRDYNLLSLATRVLEAWKKDPELRLRKMTVEEFEKILKDFEKAMRLKSANKALRSPVVNDLKKLDKEIDKNINVLKSMIKLRFGLNNYESYYLAFGFVKRGRYRGLPVNRTQRLFALKKLLQALREYNLNNEICGIDYWQDVYNRYTALYNENISRVQNIATWVGEKKELRKKIVLTLKSIKKQLEIDFPKDTKLHLRSYGFFY